jgi:hypothetical protein
MSWSGGATSGEVFAAGADTLACSNTIGDLDCGNPVRRLYHKPCICACLPCQALRLPESTRRSQARGRRARRKKQEELSGEEPEENTREEEGNFKLAVFR